MKIMCYRKSITYLLILICIAMNGCSVEAQREGNLSESTKNKSVMMENQNQQIVASKVFSRMRKFYKLKNNCSGYVSFNKIYQDKNSEKTYEVVGEYKFSYSRETNLFLLNLDADLKNRLERKITLQAFGNEVTIYIDQKPYHLNTLRGGLLKISSKSSARVSFMVPRLLLFSSAVDSWTNNLQNIDVIEKENYFVVTGSINTKELLDSDTDEIIVRRFWINTKDYSLIKFQEEYPINELRVKSFNEENFQEVNCFSAID